MLFFTFNTFLQKNGYYVREHVWKNLVYNAIFALQFFRLAGYWKRSNKIPTPIQICTGLADAVLRPNRLQSVP